ncbi:hypothetical protein [Burkholderia sp. MS455]|uniref:hypothetical protein n=1 Tax=Burkholderia sp. MS455 TaxID=2811788 RepID=UPI0019561027|nr:hypothetical protein [Burkholderia sp. MS455]
MEQLDDGVGRLQPQLFVDQRVRCRAASVTPGARAGLLYDPLAQRHERFLDVFGARHNEA